MSSNHNSFGEFIAQKRMQHGITVRGMAGKLDISPGYYSDIEHSRRIPPTENLERFIEIFHLNEEERILLLDLAGKARAEVSSDLPDYIMENDFVRVALRVAKEKASPDDWRRFIDDLERKG